MIWSLLKMRAIVEDLSLKKSNWRVRCSLNSWDSEFIGAIMVVTRPNQTLLQEMFLPSRVSLLPHWFYGTRNCDYHYSLDFH